MFSLTQGQLGSRDSLHNSVFYQHQIFLLPFFFCNFFVTQMRSHIGGTVMYPKYTAFKMLKLQEYLEAA